MTEDSFKYKSQCEIAITSEEVIPETITDKLNITPDRYFYKGEKSVSKHSGSIITKPHNLWAIKSKTVISEEETIRQHIEYFKTILSPRGHVLNSFKNDSRFEISFWIWVETDNAGIGFELSEDEIQFLSSICNRIHFSVITNENI